MCSQRTLINNYSLNHQTAQHFQKDLKNKEIIQYPIRESTWAMGRALPDKDQVQLHLFLSYGAICRAQFLFRFENSAKKFLERHFKKVPNKEIGECFTSAKCKANDCTVHSLSFGCRLEDTTEPNYVRCRLSALI